MYIHEPAIRNRGITYCSTFFVVLTLSLLVAHFVAMNAKILRMAAKPTLNSAAMYRGYNASPKQIEEKIKKKTKQNTHKQYSEAKISSVLPFFIYA